VPTALTNGLAQAMFDNNRRVGLEAVYGLGVMARPPLDQYAADALARALQDNSADVRTAAARVTGGLRVRTAGDALVAALNDKDASVASAAMRSLGDLKAWQSLQALTEQFTFYEGKGPRAEAALGSADVVSRERAVMVLGFIGGDEAFERLERARTDSDLRVVRAAERAIARLRKN
jgi:HEAT repeat protein